MLFAQTIGKPGWRHYLAAINNKSAAIAALYSGSKIASLALAGTIPEFRGAGAQTALIQRRLNDALELGCEMAVVETAEDTPERPSISFKNLIKCGFEIAYERKILFIFLIIESNQIIDFIK